MHVQKMMMLLLIMMLMLMMMIMTIKAKHTRSFCGAHPSGANVVGGRWQRARKFVACFVLFVVAAFLFYRRINMEIFH